MYNKVKILVLKDSYNLGKFKIFPLNNGYGITIGNTIRRVLLSSIYGFSVSYFKINGIIHEFSYIKGIIEDVSEIILNLKQIRFKLKNKKFDIDKEIIDININNKKNKIYAGDIDNFSNYFEVINKKFVICNKDESVDFNINLIVDRGKGYVPSEKKKKYNSFIAIDSIYTPIKNVYFKVKNINNNKEILKLNIITDGSIYPTNALVKSSKKLINILNIFSKKKYLYKLKKEKKIKKYDEKYLKMRKLLNSNLDIENFSVRTINCFKKSKIYTWGELVNFKKSDLLKIKNFGKKSLKELINKMKKKKLNFKMDIKKYKI
ncbi:MAG: DNA-directed RNA polymerase subunit alpha [Candidatus Shikimatogenerans bostrichidophilus]|nr:MAG: DNA-directed RNA polymerase subunit alpha [Candidatus Shikimatogenerans bostrichidophilus]